MATVPQYGPISQQYAAAATVPLIKAPSLWLPPRVEFPPDVHPLPEDITAYFVYPFSLERHVVSTRPAPHEAIADRRARNAALLHQREQEEEQRERDALRRVAPGYNPAALLVPISATPHPHPPAPALAPATMSGAAGTASGTWPAGPGAGAGAGSAGPAAQASADPMDDLVARLEEMESRR